MTKIEIADSIPLSAVEEPIGDDDPSPVWYTDAAEKAASVECSDYATGNSAIVSQSVSRPVMSRDYSVSASPNKPPTSSRVPKARTDTAVD